MNEMTKEVLLNLLRNLKQSTQNTRYAYRMAWQTYFALSKMLPDFQDAYENAEREVSFAQLEQWHADQIRQLDAAVQLLESV